MSETPSNFDADNTPEVAAPPQPPTSPATPAVPTPPATPVAPAVQTPTPEPALAPAAPAVPSATYAAPAAPAAPAAQTTTGAVPSSYGAQNMAYTGAPEQVAPAFQVPPATKSFFSRLFDMSFSTYITPSIVKLMYILSLIGIWGSWIVYLIIGTAAAGEWDASAGFMAFLGIFILGGLAAFLSTLVVRASLEFLVATIKTAENTNRLRELKEVENQ